MTHNIALKENGTVFAWGPNINGQLCDGTIIDKALPVQVFGLNRITSITTGLCQSLALKNDGTVWSWGRNIRGQLGDWSWPIDSHLGFLIHKIKKEKGVPEMLSGIPRIKQISEGNSHCIALTVDGKVLSWGSNSYGQLGNGMLSKSHVQRNPVFTCGLDDVQMISAGHYHNFALKGDGSVWAWGSNSYGELGYGYPTYLPEPVASDIEFVYNTYATQRNKLLKIPVINKTQKNITITYSTKDRTAISGIDYIAATGNIDFHSYKQEKYISVRILNNKTTSNLNKIFIVYLNNVFHNENLQIKISISSISEIKAPYKQIFSHLMPADGWKYYSSQPTGRIHVVNGKLRMDSWKDNTNNLNEAILSVDISSITDAFLNFYYQSIANDKCTSLPSSYTNHYKGDGISISNDENRWYRIIDCKTLLKKDLKNTVSINIDKAATYIKSNIDSSFKKTRNIKIKFQQYGKRTYPSGGAEWDNIHIDNKPTNTNVHYAIQ